MYIATSRLKPKASAVVIGRPAGIPHVRQSLAKDRLSQKFCGLVLRTNMTGRHSLPFDYLVAVLIEELSSRFPNGSLPTHSIAVLDVASLGRVEFDPLGAIELQCKRTVQSPVIDRLDDLRLDNGKHGADQRAQRVLLLGDAL